jgi:AraC-like DNA-binding protein
VVRAEVLPQNVEQVYDEKYLRDKNVPINVYFLNADEMPHGGRHAHWYVQIVYVYRGRCEHTIGDSRHEMVKGDVFVIPPLVPHSLRALGSPDVQVFECDFMPSLINEHLANLNDDPGIFDFAYLEPFLMAENLVRPRLNVSTGARERIEALLMEMLAESRTKKTGYAQCLKAELLLLLVLLGREYGRTAPSDSSVVGKEKYRKAIDDALRFISECYRSDIGLRDVCARAGMCASAFSKSFKQVTKSTFVEYITKLRVNDAMELLRDSALKIIDVCLTVGFHDVSHFDRVFHSIVGVSPSMYRKISQEVLPGGSDQAPSRSKAQPA